MPDKLVAIHSQGNWAGVSVDFVVVPDGTDMMELYDIHSSQSCERDFSGFIVDTERGRYANEDDIEIFAEGTDAAKLRGQITYEDSDFREPNDPS